MSDVACIEGSRCTCGGARKPYRFIACAWFDLVYAIEDGCAGAHGFQFGHAYIDGTPVHSLSASNLQGLARAYVDAAQPSAWPKQAAYLARVPGLARAVANMWRFFSVCAASSLPSAPCQRQQGLCWGATLKPPAHPWPALPSAAYWLEMSGALEAIRP